MLQSVDMLNCRLPRYSNIDFYEKGPHIFFLLGPSVRIIIRSECIINTRNLAVIEGDAKNLRLIYGHFLTISSHLQLFLVISLQTT